MKTKIALGILIAPTLIAAIFGIVKNNESNRVAGELQTANALIEDSDRRKAAFIHRPLLHLPETGVGSRRNQSRRGTGRLRPPPHQGHPYP